MTLKKLILTIAGCLGIIGVFVPWYRASLFGLSVTANAFGLDNPLYVILGLIAILCSVVIILLNVLKEKQIKKIIKNKAFIKNLSKIMLGTGIALVAIAIISFIAIQNESKGFGGVSFGIWLIGLAGVAVIVLPFLKNVEILEKVIIGQPEEAEKTEKSEKTEKKETTKKTTK